MQNQFRRVLLIAFALFSGSTSAVGPWKATIHTTMSLGFGPAHQPYSPPSTLLGVEGTYGIGKLLDLGLFLDYNLLTAKGTGTSDSWAYLTGPMARFAFGVISGVFVDGKLGLTRTGDGRAAFGYGGGFGYRITVNPSLQLGLRAGARMLPFRTVSGSTDHILADMGLFLSFGF